MDASAGGDPFGPAPRAGGAVGKQNLQHMMGVRAVGTIWIVCAHFASRGPIGSDLWENFYNRAHIAVNYFMLAGGFGMHWGHGRRRLLQSGLCEWSTWYVGRVEGLLVTTVLTCSAAVLLEWGSHSSLTQAAETTLGSQAANVSYYLGMRYVDNTLRYATCALAIEPMFYWHDELPCPNALSWYATALAICVLLYPLFSFVTGKIDRLGGLPALVGSALLVYGLSKIPSLLYVFHVEWYTSWSVVTAPPHILLFVTYIPDFIIGVLVAAATRRLRTPALAAAATAESQSKANPDGAGLATAPGGEVASSAMGGPKPGGLILQAKLATGRVKFSKSRARGLLADVSMLALIVCAVVDMRSPDTIAFPPGSLTPLAAIFLAAASEGDGIFASIFRNPFLTDVGALALPIYLLQCPVALAFEWLYLATEISPSPTRTAIEGPDILVSPIYDQFKWHAADVFVAYWLCLWLTAVFYTRVVEPNVLWALHAACRGPGRTCCFITTDDNEPLSPLSPRDSREPRSP